jgi:hypothetical protein
MQRAMATEAEATREARAKVVAAEGEQKASVALKQAADTLFQNPIALQLRYLQTLTHIAAEKNSTIVFPIPIEFLKTFSTLETTTNKKNKGAQKHHHSDSNSATSSYTSLNAAAIAAAAAAATSVGGGNIQNTS